MLETIYEHLLFYKTFLWNWWNTLGPTGYTGLLIAVGVLGWVTMRGPKGT